MTYTPAKSRHVAFAERFATRPANGFAAFAALERARLLVREAQKIGDIFKEESNRDDPGSWSWHGLEIVPYTLVGLATCLEWHARSRLTDLYSYKPEEIEPKALEGKVPPKVLSQMIKANISIPQLLGASITIGSVNEYLDVFRTLFESLKFPEKPDTAIQPPIVEQIGIFGDPIHEPLVRDRLEELFTTRHLLVHEIGSDSATGRTVCETWGPARVARMGVVVIATITALEQILTQHAPADFPNLLTDRGYPVDVRARLNASILALETEITAEIAKGSPAAQALWDAAQETARTAAEAQERLFEDHSLFQDHQIGRANLLLQTSLRQRVNLLTEIASRLAASRSVGSI